MTETSRCPQGNTERHIGKCRRFCHETWTECRHANRNVAFGKRILEGDCDCDDAANRSDARYRPDRNFLQCTRCGKRAVCDKCLNPRQLTDGNVHHSPRIHSLGYSEFSGFAAVIPPGTVTVDLEQEYDIAAIQFLLWDNRGNDKEENCGRRYYYRLLTATSPGRSAGTPEAGKSLPPDRWEVIHDGLNGTRAGWQVLRFNPRKKVRYIRIQCIADSDRQPFGIVQLEAYEKQPEGYDYNPVPSFDWTVVNQRPSSRDKLPKRAKYYNLTQFMTAITDGITEFKSRNSRMTELVRRANVLQNDLLAIERELYTHEHYLNQELGSIFRNTQRTFNISMWLLLLGLGFTVLSALAEPILRIFHHFR